MLQPPERLQKAELSQIFILVISDMMDDIIRDNWVLLARLTCDINDFQARQPIQVAPSKQTCQLFTERIRRIEIENRIPRHVILTNSFKARPISWACKQFK